MPTLSLYSFSQPQLELGGGFTERHVDLSSDNFASDPIELANRGAALAIVRPDDEDVVDLNDMYNSFQVLFPTQDRPMSLFELAALAISKSPYGGSLRGPLRSAPLNRDAIPSYLVIPPDEPNQVLTELHIDFHLNTDGICFAHEGTITFYVQFLCVSSGRIRAAVLGEWFTPDTNPDPCASGVNDELNKLLFNKDSSGAEKQGAVWPYDMRTFLNQIYFAKFDSFLGQLVAARPPVWGPNPPLYRRIYGLPGDGRRAGAASEDASIKYSLGLERLPVVRVPSVPHAPGPFQESHAPNPQRAPSAPNPGRF